MEQARRELKHGVKRGEGELKRNGKPVARVIFYEGTRGVVVGKTVSSIEDIPKSTQHIAITTFDALGYPKGKTQTITRDEMNNYTMG